MHATLQLQCQLSDCAIVCSQTLIIYGHEDSVSVRRGLGSSCTLRDESNGDRQVCLIGFGKASFLNIKHLNINIRDESRETPPTSQLVRSDFYPIMPKLV